MKELDDWLNQETWHTFHPLDEERFNKGTFRLLSGSPKKPSGQDVLTYIEGKLGIDHSHPLYESAVSYATRYESIESFISENGIKL